MNFSEIGIDNKWLCSGGILGSINDFDVTSHSDYLIHYTATKLKVVDLNETLSSFDL